MVNNGSTPLQPATTEDLMVLVMGKLGIPTRDAMAYAVRWDLLEYRDMLQAELPVRRRDAARILHTVLQKVLEEPDETDWSAAERLLDLYDCRTCVQHIAQIYVKGILSEGKPRCFENEAFLTLGEAELAAERLADKEKRRPVVPGRGTSREITLEEAHQLLQNEGARLIDVRSPGDYARGHRPGARNIPLGALQRHPHSAGDHAAPVILYCARGYQSRLAAELLLQAGFRQVYTMPGMLAEADI